MSQSKYFRSSPKSMRQKHVLDVAANNPDASIEGIASEIPSATVELVERVLDEYGDPAGDTPESQSGDDAMDDADFSTDADAPADHPVDSGDETDDESVRDSSPAEEDAYPTVDDLSEPQLETLRAIHEHPEATQREIAEGLDVCAATVCNRVNDIEGFTWKHRGEFVETVLGTEPTTATDDSATMSETRASQPQTAPEQLTDRIATIEQQVEKLTAVDESDSVFGDAELAHKVAHACLKSDVITEEEELQILKELLQE